MLSFSLPQHHDHDITSSSTEAFPQQISERCRIQVYPTAMTPLMRWSKQNQPRLSPLHHDARENAFKMQKKANRDETRRRRTRMLWNDAQREQAESGLLAKMIITWSIFLTANDDRSPSLFPRLEIEEYRRMGNANREVYSSWHGKQHTIPRVTQKNTRWESQE